MFSQRKSFKYTILIAISVVLIAVMSFAAVMYHNNGYSRFPPAYESIDSLVRYIKPVKHYSYWVVMSFGHGDANDTIFKFGKKPLKLTVNHRVMGGFFVGCMPGMCYYYIAYVDNGIMHYVTNEKELCDFIGTIDNLQEALLVAKAKEGVYISDRFGIGYKEEKGRYELMLTRYKNCPELIESIYLQINKSGIKKVKRIGVDKVGGCVIY